MGLPCSGSTFMPGLNDFLSRIQTDHVFYLQFRQSPQEALASYELSSEERAALTESGPGFSAQLARTMSVQEPSDVTVGASIGVESSVAFKWITNIGWIRTRETEPTDLTFDPEVALDQPEVQQTIAQIRSAGTHAERLAAIATLMEYIG